jgi:hypothetical protein
MNKISIINDDYKYNYIYINYKINQISILLELKRMELINKIKNNFSLILNKYNIDVNNVFPRWLMLFFNTKSDYFIDPIIPFFTKEKKPNNKQLIKDIYNLSKQKFIVKSFNFKKECNESVIKLQKYKFKKNININIIVENNFYIFKYENYKYKLHKTVYDKLIYLGKSYKNNINELIFCLILRYNTLESYNQQLAVNPEFYNYLKNNYKINFELFASPFNCFFDNYCSLFFDLEKYFNSKGNFRNIRLNQGFYIANPPYDEEIMKKMTIKILKRLKKTIFDLSFLIIIPIWNNLKYGVNMTTEYIKNSKFLIDIIKVEKKKAKFFDYYLYKFVYPCDIYIILLQNDKGKTKYNISLKNIINMFY